VDDIDRKILSLLQHDGRITLTDLAVQVGLSVSPCHRRLRELERSGVISGYRAVIDAGAVGLGFEVLAFVTMRQEDRETLLGFEAGVAAIPPGHPGRAPFLGDPDYLLRILTVDLAAYQVLEDDHLAVLPGVQRITSTLVMKRIAHNPPAAPLSALASAGGGLVRHSIEDEADAGDLGAHDGEVRGRTARSEPAPSRCRRTGSRSRHLRRRRSGPRA
jgi:DNA-binding Lrp family transcriptional regulator